MYEGKIISGRERQEKGERPVNIFHVAAGRENSCGVEMVFNVKATKATQIMSEHHWSCTSVSKGWIPPALSPTRGACVGLVVPVIYLLIAQLFLPKQLALQTLLGIQGSPGDVEGVSW